jgi:hypothetical protein
MIRITAPHSHRVLPALALLVLLGVASVADAGAQGAAAAPSCLDTLSATAFHRVPVFIEARAADSAARAILPAADTLAIRVALLIQSSLGDSTTALPEGEALLRWRDVGGKVRVAAHRDGTLTWMADAPLSGDDTLHAPMRSLLAQALGAARAAGAHIAWPSDAREDSLSFDLEVRVPDIRPPGVEQRMMARFAVPVFSMAMPWSTEVVVRHEPTITYPEGARSGSVEGTVILEFDVDTAGRAVPSPVTDIWPASRPRLTGAAAARYREFLEAAKRSLGSARFRPATVGGCAVHQRVQWPFEFHLAR